MYEGDYPREECGIFGIFDHSEASHLTYLGLYALQHRGQESAGIVTCDEGEPKSHRGMGLVADAFTPNTLRALSGYSAIGHVRYSTTGSSLLKNAQPFLAQRQKSFMAVAHNGNLVNARLLKEKLESQGSIFQSTMDSEIFVHLIARSKKPGYLDKTIQALSHVRGAYSLILLTENGLIGARDPHGFRPLCLGRLKGSFVLASETCALDLVQARYINDIQPGEVVMIDKHGLHSEKPFSRLKPSFCIFEYIYFARPDSNIFGQSVYLVRKKLGARLAEEAPAEADFVMPIPDSGNYAALGFAERTGLPFEMGMIRNHYVGRTFIQPSQSVRDFGVKIKLNPVKDLLRGKRVVVIEDSIVRGTTSRTRIRALRDAGVKEVHMRVSCPPHRFPCHYGIDFPTREELIGSSRSVEEIRKFIGLDSLAYLSLEGMVGAMPQPRKSFCLACYNGKYPVPVSPETDKFTLEG
ncbi:MAG: amidophosphoribosyltransferase [Deltaproteobacteria bacterium SM23_61]|nr:MAG: amidophosphoribosyltransferase [Deltaproteobacteria bacterium SM23_61]